MAKSLWERWGCNGIFGQTACLTRIFFRIRISGRIVQIHQVAQPALSRHDRLLWALLALTALIRLVAIDRPLLGNFATKNVVYAMIARNWAEGRADLWHPTLDCLVGDQRGLHMLEFPVSAYVAGGLWKLGKGSLDAWGRGVSVLFSVASVAVLWQLVVRRHGRVAAGAACLVLALSPVCVLYGQSFMLESSLVFFVVGAWWAADRWAGSGRWSWLVVYGLCLSLLLLTKIYALVYLLPLLLIAWRPAFGQAVWRARGMFFAASVLAMIPAGIWYAHAYATGQPDSPLAHRVYYSVRNSAAVHALPSPLLRSPEFYVRMLDDLSGPVLTPVGCALLLASLLTGCWRTYGAWLAAAALLVLALPLKFYEMNYYWMAVLPPLCVLAGVGWEAIHSRFCPSRMAVLGLVLLLAVWSLRYSARPAFVTPGEDRQVVAAGHELQRMAGPDDRVVTMHGSCIDLLYYCNRPGWAVDPGTKDLPAVLDECRRNGARWLVLVGRASTELEQVKFLTSVLHTNVRTYTAGSAVLESYSLYRVEP